MDFAKFVWLLQRRALWFCRADLLGDPHEGALPLATVQERDERVSIQRKAMLRTMAEDGVPESMREQESRYWAPGIDPDAPTKVLVQAMFVSCWNLCEYENAALWGLYGSGLAIRSSFSALKVSLTCEEPVYIGRVRYIDYRRDSFPTDNALQAVVHKRLYFESEQELRAVIIGEWHADPERQELWTGDPRPGIEASVDLDRLVEAVYVAPGENLLRDVVDGVVKSYGLGASVEQSSLDDPPHY